MPHFDYKCTDCEFEILDHYKSVMAPHLEICPKCDKTSLIQLFSSPNTVIFKGEDWPDKEVKKSRTLTAHQKRNFKRAGR